MYSEKIRKHFISRFNGTPLVVRAPGRINLIGEHTDYNDGYVMPAAIDKGIVCAITPNYSNICHLFAYDLDEEHEFSLEEFEKSEKGWPNYIMGVVDQFQKRGLNIQGFDCVFGGNIPLGAGLSSSAALECAFAYSLNILFDHKLSNLELTKLALGAENEFVGLNCGIMDQFASIHGKANHVMRLDCRTLEYEYFDFKMEKYGVVLCDTRVEHSLASSEYNTRRTECEKGVEILKKYDPSVKALRDASPELIEKHRDEMGPVIYNRSSYVVEENIRVLETCDLLSKGDMIAVGKKLYESHEGLSKKYEVSCDELDFLVEKTKSMDMVIGARMMGGGFGGCTINLVKIDRLNQFIDEISSAYKNKFDIELKTYTVRIVNGTGKL
jgi:galactokinase